MRRAILVAGAVALAIGCSRPRGDPRAELAFSRDGREVRRLTLDQLTASVPLETWSAYDPYYNKRKTYRALPLRAVLLQGFRGVDGAFETQEFVLRARDGYTVPITGARLSEDGAYLAVADVEVPSWEPIGPARANPGPFYVVWRGDAQQSLETHPRPWQLASIEMARFERVFPHTVPTGEPEGGAAARGFRLFREGCVRCHAINREGGRIGPDLNLPLSIVEYRPREQIRAYIRDPLAFRHGNMPPHPHLTDADLDALLAYFDAMKSRKHTP